MQKKLSEIAQLVEGKVLGNAELIISGVTNIEDAGENDITFAVPPHLEKAALSRAAAVILPDSTLEFAKPAILVPNPRVAFAKLLELFTPPVTIERGVHPTAVLGKNVRLGNNVAIMPYAVVADNVTIGDNTVIYPHVYLGNDVTVGSDAILYPSVTVREGCVVGNRVILHSGAVIGGDGFGFVNIGGQHRKVPQIGNAVLEDDVEIGSNSAVDRATTGSTLVRKGTKVDNFVHIAHNDVIGENCYLVAFTGLSGSLTVGNNVTFAGQSGSAGHLTIGDNCVFAARAGIISDVPAGSFFGGFPARPHREWLRDEAGIRKISDLTKKVKELEKRLAQMEAGSK